MARYSHLVLACGCALLGVGVVMVHSAGVSPTAMGSASAEGLWSGLGMFGTRHTVFAGLAVGVMLLASRVDAGRWLAKRGWGNPLFGLVFVTIGLLVLTAEVGVEVNGARRWLRVGPVQFQPSEVAKWVLVGALAWWCGRRRGVMHRFGAGLVPPLVLVAVVCGLVAKEDLGTGVLLGAVALSVLLAGGARWWQVGGLVVVGLAGAVAMIWAAPFRMKRLAVFMDPWSDASGVGYHPIQSMLAFAEGGVTGSGLGHSVQKYYLPEDTTDFVFPVLAEEMGFAGAALVVALYLVLLWVGWGVLQRRTDVFGRLLGLGILLTIGFQAVINLAVVTVVAPTKGIALPLISAGGTGWVLTGLMVGLLAGLDREAGEVAALDGDAVGNGVGDGGMNPPAKRGGESGGSGGVGVLA
ncbi:MAG: putative peptidoglycan glycosyltransferase FtsW [Planctomycetota bacterium]